MPEWSLIRAEGIVVLAEFVALVATIAVVSSVLPVFVDQGIMRLGFGVLEVFAPSFGVAVAAVGVPVVTHSTVAVPAVKIASVDQGITRLGFVGFEIFD
jgi:hypothetical protein